MHRVHGSQSCVNTEEIACVREKLEPKMRENEHEEFIGSQLNDKLIIPYFFEYNPHLVIMIRTR